ncbi:hypothetical protein ABVT39_026021 [Epinephelus coioides]
MESYVLFQGAKHVTLKEEDMTTEKISRIFQVQNSSLYITDDNNMAIFPGNEGQFRTVDLAVRGHYEVHGESDDVGEQASVPGPFPTHFSFRQPASAAAGSAYGSASTATARPSPRAPMAKTFERTIFITDLVDGRLETNKTLTVRFSEFEASVMGITRSMFWKQNARKVCAVKEGDLQQLQGSKKRGLSRRDDNGLDAVFDTIEEVVLAAQGLREVSTTIKELTNLASSNRRTTVSLTEAEAAAVKDAFACIVCKGPVVEPMVASCCHSIVGCRTCIEEWQQNSAICPKCRAGNFGINTQKLTGLSDALAALENILC